MESGMSREMLEAAIGAYLRQVEPDPNQSVRVVKLVERVMRKIDRAAEDLRSLRALDQLMAEEEERSERQE